MVPRGKIHRTALITSLFLCTVSVSFAHAAGDGQTPLKIKAFKSPSKFRLIQFPKARAAPDFSLPDLHGNVRQLKDFRGKVILLNFWATWCPPCIKEMPSMERLWQRFRGRAFEVVAVSMDSGSVDPVRKFIKEGKLTFVVLQDAQGKTEVPFGIRGLPISYVIDHEGRMVAGAIGEQNWDSKKSFEYFDKLVKKVPTK